MAEGNGKVRLAVLSTDLKYVKASQVALESAFSTGMREIKEELKDIKQMQGNNQQEILVAKSSLKAMKGLIMAVGAVITFAITVFAALR